MTRPQAASTVNTSQDLAVRITDLGHTYGATRAMDHVNLALPEGKTIGLVGPDRKSTRLNSSH